jgi:hypothetical protein
MKLTRHIGIDYSGAQTPESRLNGLQVHESRNGGTPERIGTPAEVAKSWTRLEAAQFCASAFDSDEPVTVVSPLRAMDRRAEERLPVRRTGPGRDLDRCGLAVALVAARNIRGETAPVTMAAS